MTKRALAVLIVCVLAGPLSAASFDISVDPRFELLGVLYTLAGRGRSGDAVYRKAVEKRFKPFRGHSVMKTFKGLVARSSRAEAVATLPVHYSPPPELELLDKADHIPYLEREGEREEMERFLAELRDFARVSDFMGFFRDNREFYATVEGSARRRLGSLDPVAALESYLGLPLESRVHYIIPLLYDNTNNYIVPYPLPFTAAGAKSFDVYTVSPDLATDRFSAVLFNELIYVFIDPSFFYFDKLNAPVPAEFYGPEIARCRTSPPFDCAKHYVASAISYRVLRKGLPDAPAGGALSAPEMKALSARLDEYEAHRDRYPTLWDFYPRLLGVFRERAFPGAAAAPAAPLKPIRKVTDFFDPALKPDAQ
jgi:hypothetical protein